MRRQQDRCGALEQPTPREFARTRSSRGVRNRRRDGPRRHGVQEASSPVELPPDGRITVRRLERLRWGLRSWSVRWGTGRLSPLSGGLPGGLGVRVGSSLLWELRSGPSAAPWAPCCGTAPVRAVPDVEDAFTGRQRRSGLVETAGVPSRSLHTTRLPGLLPGSSVADQEPGLWCRLGAWVSVPPAPDNGRRVAVDAPTPPLIMPKPPRSGARRSHFYRSAAPASEASAMRPSARRLAVAIAALTLPAVALPVAAWDADEIRNALEPPAEHRLFLPDGNRHSYTLGYDPTSRRARLGTSSGLTAAITICRTRSGPATTSSSASTSIPTGAYSCG
jgi:hypothetical protein